MPLVTAVEKVVKWQHSKLRRKHSEEMIIALFVPEISLIDCIRLHRMASMHGEAQPAANWSNAQNRVLGAARCSIHQHVLIRSVYSRGSEHSSSV
eukprot:4850017-Pleurochrysis_carterae.AAC.2